MSRCLMLVVLATVAAPCAATDPPSMIFVDAGADQAPHDGSDWCHAYLQLHEALDSAAPGAVIRVADGTYRPDTTGLVDPREAVYALANGVTIQGGYAGCGAADPNARDPALYETVLSGDIGTPDVATDNCYHVLVGTGVDGSAVLDGVTIAGGNANVSAHREGGGVRLIGGSPTLRDCTFRQNSAEYGGGIFNSGGRPTILRTRFEQNSATASGGAVYNFDSPGQPGPTLSQCIFVDNTAQSSGGALRNYDSDATVADCEFRDNHTRYGGAAVANGGQSNPLFARCVFEANRTDTLFAPYDCYGGGMHNSGNSHPTLLSCALVGNAAYAALPAHSYGGALAQTDDAEPTLINCTLVDNYANMGRGIYSGGQSNSEVVSSILWNGGDEITIAGGATIAVTFSTIAGFWPGTGNVADDPLLVDLRPQAGSPCINTGDAAYVPEDEPDLDGHARVLCGRVDMGAFEFGIGDYDCDQSLDGADSAQWGNCITGPFLGPYDAGCEAFDYEFDGDVDLTDFGSFQRQPHGG